MAGLMSSASSAKQLAAGIFVALIVVARQVQFVIVITIARVDIVSFSSIGAPSFLFLAVPCF